MMASGRRAFEKKRGYPKEYTFLSDSMILTSSLWLSAIKSLMEEEPISIMAVQLA